MPHTLAPVWEPPDSLWRRLALGREEYLQRLVSTLILGGDAPTWNTPRAPSEIGSRFLHLLEELAFPDAAASAVVEPGLFVDEYLLPKLDLDAQNGWPDWAVLRPGRVWVIELKTEPGSHRDQQLPYYLRRAAAAHPNCALDLTYITGPLRKPAPALLPGQRYRHLTWDQVLPLMETAWSHDARPEVVAYLSTVRTIVTHLGVLRPGEQRQRVLDGKPAQAEPNLLPTRGAAQDPQPARTPSPAPKVDPAAPEGVTGRPAARLLDLARETAADGRQRAAGATDPETLEELRDAARDSIAGLAADDAARYVLPWLWKATQTDGKAMTPEGAEFGYELRFSRYQRMQITS